MSQLYTDFAFKTPPEGKYASKITVATSTDEEPIAKAAAQGKEARTLAVEAGSEHSDDGKTTLDAVESPTSERQTALERLARAVAEDEQMVRDWEPLTEADKGAKREALDKSNVETYNRRLEEFRATHPDFDQVMAQASDVDISEAKRQLLTEAGPEAVYALGKAPREEQDRFAVMSDAEAEGYLQGKREPARARQSALAAQYAQAQQQALASYFEQVEQAKARHPDWEQVFAEAAKQDVQFADNVAEAIRSVGGPEVVYHLGKNLSLARQLAAMPEALAVAHIGKMAGELNLKPQSAYAEYRKGQRTANLKPTPAVGGNVKATVPLDELPYAEYRRIRDEQAKSRYRR